MQDDLHTLQTCYNNVITFKSKRTVYWPNYFFADIVLSRVDEVRDLGVIFSKNLPFRSHI